MFIQLLALARPFALDWNYHRVWNLLSGLLVRLSRFQMALLQLPSLLPANRRHFRFLIENIQERPDRCGQHAEQLSEENFARRQLADINDLLSRNERARFHVVAAEQVLDPDIFRTAVRNRHRREEFIRRTGRLFDVAFGKNRADGNLELVQVGVDPRSFKSKPSKRFLMTKKLAPDCFNSRRNLRTSSAVTFVKSAKIKEWLFQAKLWHVPTLRIFELWFSWEF